ncbi:MAG TPA: SHOCT domain-containing protein [Ktedonobacteraceae bacterium]|nr:SHOCT domain-containing protein [Ktedonobacteraceae bacterium]
MYRRGGYWGGPFMRRRGFPLFPMGGYGMGMGGIMGDLVAGGIGYMMGKQSAQQAPQYQPPQYQPQQAPQYQPPQYQPPQPPQYQAPTAGPDQQVNAASGVNERLAQLKLLGHLRDSGLLTNDEFDVEKQKIMQG